MLYRCHGIGELKHEWAGKWNVESLKQSTKTECPREDTRSHLTHFPAVSPQGLRQMGTQKLREVWAPLQEWKAGRVDPRWTPKSYSIHSTVCPICWLCAKCFQVGIPTWDLYPTKNGRLVDYPWKKPTWYYTKEIKKIIELCDFPLSVKLKIFLKP